MELWHQPQQCSGDTEAPRMILSWNISFLPTPTTSCEIINSSIHPYFHGEARRPHAAPQRTVGKALPACLTLSLDYVMSPTPWILSHSVWSRDLSACPAWVPSFLQHWKPLELDKSEIPKLNILPFPWYVAFHFIHYTNVDPFLCSSHWPRFLFFQKKKKKYQAILTAYQFSL